MHCPVDDTELRITERQGIEIDYCPKCRGVWLDRGELDKIIERSAQPAYRAEQVRTDEERALRGRADRDRYDDDRPPRDDYRGRSRRRSFLDDLFDFD